MLMLKKLYSEKDFNEIKQIALKLIQHFPKAKNGQTFLTLKNGRKMFFGIFIKKYGLDGKKCEYSDVDIARRIRLIEFFDYFVKDFDIVKKELNERGKEVYILESNFYRMVILDVRDSKGSKLELLSFYHYK